MPTSLGASPASLSAPRTASSARARSDLAGNLPKRVIATPAISTPVMPGGHATRILSTGVHARGTEDRRLVRADPHGDDPVARLRARSRRADPALQRGVRAGDRVRAR